MTAYVAAFPATNATGVSGVGIAPSSTYAIRIVRVEQFSTQACAGQMNFNTGGSLSGGSVITPVVMRGGSPNPVATVRTGSVTQSGGTTTTLNYNWSGSFSVDYTVSPPVTTQTSGSATYTFPFDFILTSGSSFTVKLTGTLGAGFLCQFAVYFEELRLAWSL